MNTSEIRYRMLKEAVKHRILPAVPKKIKKEAGLSPQDVALVIDDLSQSIAKSIIKQKLMNPDAGNDIKENGLFVLTQKEMQDFINAVANEKPKPITSSLIPPSEAHTLVGKKEPDKKDEKK